MANLFHNTLEEIKQQSPSDIIVGDYNSFKEEVLQIFTIGLTRLVDEFTKSFIPLLKEIDNINAKPKPKRKTWEKKWKHK